MQGAGSELVDSFRELFKFSFRIRSKIDEADQEAGDEEERVDTEGAISDCLEEKLLLDNLPEFHIVGVLEGNDASVPENDPSHRQGSDAVNAWNRVAANRLITNRLKVAREGKRQQKLFAQS